MFAILRTPPLRGENLMYQIVVGDQQSCPGAYSQWLTLTVGSGTIVSVAFQNNGNAQNFWTSQIFPQSSTQAYFQVVNSSLTATQWWPIVVVDTGGGAAESTVEVSISGVGTKSLAKA
jgi:hypothetical protein